MPAAALARAEPTGRVVYIGIAGVASPIDSRDLILGDLTAVGILGASAGLGRRSSTTPTAAWTRSRIAVVTAGLDDAADALAGKISTGKAPRSSSTRAARSVCSPACIRLSAAALCPSTR